MTYKLHQLDAFEWLKSLSDSSVDMVVTDPPYESLEKHRAKGTTTRLKVSEGSSNPWFQTIPNSRFPELFAHFFRVLKRDRHLYLLCDAETMFVAYPALQAAGFTVWTPLIWDKLMMGMGYHYRSQYEVVLFAEKGKRKLADLGISNVLRHKRVRGGYPTEKPVELLKVLIGQSAQPGELVVDPFFGSGSAAVAALQCGCRFEGADLSIDAHYRAQERLCSNLDCQ